MTLSAIALFTALLLQPAADPAAEPATGPALEVIVDGDACLRADPVREALAAELEGLMKPRQLRVHAIAQAVGERSLEVRMSLRDEESWVKDEVFSLPRAECAAVPALIALKAKRAVLALPELSAPDEAAPHEVSDSGEPEVDERAEGPLPQLNFVGTTIAQYGGAYMAAFALGYVTSFLAFIPVIGLPLAILVRSIGIGYAASAFGETFGEKTSDIVLPALAAFAVEIVLTTIGSVIYFGGVIGGASLMVAGPVAALALHPDPDVANGSVIPPEAAGAFGLGYAMIIGGIVVGLAPILASGPLAATAAIATHNLTGEDKGPHTGNLVLPHLLNDDARATSDDAE